MFFSFTSRVAALFCLMGVRPSGADSFYQTPLSGLCKQDWFIADFMDHDPTAGAADYLGGLQTYHGHEGIDFTLYDYRVMDEGVAVLAAAAGEVIAVQDQFPDRQNVQQPENSNFIKIRHADASEAWYYHLMRHSATVTNGQRVSVGERLAWVGSSGTIYPHLHFEVRTDNVPREIMTNDHGQLQAFAWFDSYSNQVIRQTIGMGITHADDPLLTGDVFLQTPDRYTRIHSGVCGLWIKFVGMYPGDRLYVRLRHESGPGGDIDLSASPLQADRHYNSGNAYWYPGSLQAGATYRLQYHWNEEPWQDAPGDPLLSVDDAMPELFTSRLSMVCRAPEFENGQPVLVWEGVEGKRYQVEACNPAAGGFFFTPLQTNLTVESGIGRLALPANEACSMVRVRLE